MVRLLLADVTLIRGAAITVHVRFSGGATKTLNLPRPLTAWELRMTPAEIVAEVDRLTEDYTDKQIVGILNERGALSGCGQRFSSRIVARLRREYQIKPRYDRLREKGLLTLDEMSARLDIGPQCVITWRNHGLLRGYPVNDRDDWLYEDPGPNPPRKARGVSLDKRRRFPENVVRGSQEVQCEA
jgi:hypothetical protein